MKPAAEFWNGHTTTKRIPELLDTNYQLKGFQATKDFYFRIDLLHYKQIKRMLFRILL